MVTPLCSPFFAFFTLTLQTYSEAQRNPFRPVGKTRWSASALGGVVHRT
jgi:hypothetical protein